MLLLLEEAHRPAHYPSVDGLIPSNRAKHRPSIIDPGTLFAAQCRTVSTRRVWTRTCPSARRRRDARHSTLDTRHSTRLLPTVSLVGLLFQKHACPRAVLYDVGRGVHALVDRDNRERDP